MIPLHFVFVLTYVPEVMGRIFVGAGGNGEELFGDGWGRGQICVRCSCLEHMACVVQLTEESLKQKRRDIDDIKRLRMELVGADGGQIHRKSDQLNSECTALESKV